MNQTGSGALRYIRPARLATDVVAGSGAGVEYGSTGSETLTRTLPSRHDGG
jgi:hypothetical protein